VIWLFSMVVVFALHLWMLELDAQGAFGSSTFFIQFVGVLIGLTGGLVSIGVAIGVKRPACWWLLVAALLSFFAAWNSLLAFGEATGAV